MSTWFSVAAVAPSLARDWQLSTPQLGLLTVMVQLGFVTGGLASAVSGISDIVPARRVFTASALAAAAANAALVLTGGHYPAALALRFVLGFTLAGVYPTGMKVLTEWFRAGRGLAIGTLVGAIALSTAVPHLLAGIGLAGALPWQFVINATSLGAVISAIIVVVFVRQGPFASPAGRVDLGWALRSLRAPALRLANFGYLGHMWELFAMWTWLPAFLLASMTAWDPALQASVAGRWASLAAALAIAAGAPACIAAGLLADRVGRTTVTAGAMAISGACAVATGLLFGGAPALIIAVAIVWGVAVIADSAQFSASVSELAEHERVGSALALQTALGFLLTAVSIQLLPLIQSTVGWPGSLAMLAIGPALGVIAMVRLRARPEAIRLAGGRR